MLNQFGDELEAADLTDLMKAVNVSSDVGMSKNDFVLAMAMRLGKVQKYDKSRIQAVFESLDKDRNGQLDNADLVDLLAKQKQRMMKRGMSGRMVSAPPPIRPRRATLACVCPCACCRFLFACLLPPPPPTARIAVPSFTRPALVGGFSLLPCCPPFISHAPLRRHGKRTSKILIRVWSCLWTSNSLLSLASCL